MENSENGKKIAIVVLIIILLLGIIMMIKLVKKDEIPEDNTISTTNNSTNIIKNTVKDNNTNTTNETNELVESNTVVDNTVQENNVMVSKEVNSSSSTKDVIYKNNSISSNNLSNKDGNTTPANIDTTSPTLDVKYSIESKTNQDVVVTISSNEKLKGVEGWTLSSDLQTLTKTYSENTSEEIYVKDLAGNITTVNINIVNIDKIFPKVKWEYSITSNTNKDVEVKITADKELQEIEGWTLSSNKLELVKKYKENKIEQIKVRDLAGNEVPIEIKIENIDKEKPENAKVTDTLFLTKEINTKLILEDKISGIDLNKSFYKIDSSKEIGSDISSYNKVTSEEMQIKQTVNSDGTYYLHVISVDNTGNKNQNTIKLTVDTVLPKVTVNYSTTNYTKNNVVVTVTANKAMKEVNGWSLSDDKTTFTKTYTSNKEEKVTFTDLLGRTVEVTISVKNIDKISPVEPKLSQTIFNSKPIDNSKNIDINLNVTIKDNESGLDLSKCKYILNQSNKKITDFSSANTFKTETQTLHFTIKENSTYYLHILEIDKVGNTSYTIHTIISDTLNPIVTREYSNKEITNQNVIVTVKSNEVLQGKEGWEVYDGGLTLRKEYTENVGRKIENFYDLAGNPVGVDIQITNIDKISPNEATVSKTQFNIKNFKLTVRLSDNYSGIDLTKSKYVLDTNKTSNYSGAKAFTKISEELSFNVNADGIYYLHILSVDKAGNETDTVKEIKVDTTSPVGKVTYSKTDITNENVLVTITSNEPIQAISGWDLSNDKKVLTKTFSANTNSNVTITDLLGNTSTVNVAINNIDKKVPNATVEYSTTTQTTNNVVVTIKADEKIVSTEGWTLSSDSLTLTKTFSENATETVTIRDLAGNYKTVSVIVANIK